MALFRANGFLAFRILSWLLVLPKRAVGDRSAADARLGRDDEGRAVSRGSVYPDVVDLHQPGGSFRGLGRRAHASDGCCHVRGGNGCRANGKLALCAATVTSATNQAVGSGLVQHQIGLFPVETALTLCRIAAIPMARSCQGTSAK